MIPLPLENRIKGDRGQDFERRIRTEWLASQRTCYFDRLLLTETDDGEIILWARPVADTPLPEDDWSELASGRTWDAFGASLLIFTRVGAE